MVAVERFWQGDRNARMRLDKAPWTLDKICAKAATHLTWLLIAVATGGAFVFYFADAPTLVRQFFDLRGAARRLHLRRHLDRHHLCAWRHRPRAGLHLHVPLAAHPGRDVRSRLAAHLLPRLARRAARPPQAGTSLGGPRRLHRLQACVAVCPMGIDIRDGAQLECIQCALCIDACDEIMDKVGRPRGLIAYDTLRNFAAAGKRRSPSSCCARAWCCTPPPWRSWVIMLTALVLRPDLEVSVLHDRNPIYVRLSEGGLRNGYTVKLLNKLYEPHTFRLALEGLPGASLSIIGVEQQTGPAVTVPPDDLQSLRLYVTLDKEGAAALSGEATDFSLVVTDAADGGRAEHKRPSGGPNDERDGVARQRHRRPACAARSCRLFRRDLLANGSLPATLGKLFKDRVDALALRSSIGAVPTIRGHGSRTPE